jgi:putative hydrolase of the HAD superfamily
VRAFEKGKITPETFALGVISQLNLNITADAFLEDFARWEQGPYPGALQLLEKLKKKYTIACLTNNNVVHWETLTAKSDIGRKFHHSYISFEVGLLKPESEFYEYALREMHLDPGDVLFLDDNEKNVKAAFNLGIRAFQVQGLDEVKRVLTDEKILKDY